MFDDSKAPQLRKPGTPFGMVDVTVMRDGRLTAHVKLVYACLTTYADPLGVAFPSKARLARDAGLSVRTVDAAIAAAEAVGLFSVERRKREDSKQHHVNRYVLHDHGRGFVSFPARGTAGDAAPPSAGDAVGTARGAQEQDHRTRPSPVSTTSTSGDAACAPHADARGSENAPPAPKLYLRRDFATLTDKGARRHMVAAAVKALEFVGLTPTDDAAHRIGRALKEQHDAGTSRERLVEMLRNTIADPVKNELVATATSPRPTPPGSNPAAVLDVDDMEFCERVEELVEEATGGGVRPDTTAMIYGMASAGAHPSAIYNAAKKNERVDPWAS